MTEEQSWLSRKYVAYKVFTNMWFVGAVWLYFYRIFITDQQVGVLDGLAFAIGLVAEVPSGALADKFGRHRIVRIGQILAGTGLIIQALGSSFMPFFVGQSIMMIGASFASGADDALFFERLKFKRGSTDWRKLVTRGTQAGLIASLFAYLFGAYLHTLNPRLPWALNGLAFIIAGLTIWRITDTRSLKTRQRISLELKDYLSDIKKGFRQFRLPKLWLYVPYIIAVQGVFYAAGWGLLRLVLFSRFDFSPFFGSVVLAVSSLSTVGILAMMHKHAERISERFILTIIGVAAALSLLLSVPPIGIFGVMVILALYIGEHILHPFMSETLNNHAPETQRATVLSVANFLRVLPYIVLAPLIGTLNTKGQLHFFLIGWAIFIFVSAAIYLSRLKQNTKISLTNVN